MIALNGWGDGAFITDATGSANLVFTVPTLTPGAYTLTAKIGSGYYATTGFTVMASIRI